MYFTKMMISEGNKKMMISEGNRKNEIVKII